MVKIAHIADVHWRGLSRHDEYRQIFESFIYSVQRDGIEHIFIAGDIFHTKTIGISPEYIQQLTWWLTSMSNVCDVHIMLGNHDGNLVNSSRQDAITPIVEAINSNKIHLYKMSGNYEFAPGYVWCIFSLFDSNSWDTVKPVPGKVNIACYHGPVWGCRTETDWVIEDGINVDYFSEFDFAFLGDIHKMQYLGYKDAEIIVDESELGKYPNSTIIEEISL